MQYICKVVGLVGSGWTTIYPVVEAASVDEARDKLWKEHSKGFTSFNIRSIDLLPETKTEDQVEPEANNENGAAQVVEVEPEAPFDSTKTLVVDPTKALFGN